MVRILSRIATQTIYLKKQHYLFHNTEGFLGKRSKRNCSISWISWQRPYPRPFSGQQSVRLNFWSPKQSSNWAGLGWTTVQWLAHFDWNDPWNKYLTSSDNRADGTVVSVKIAWYTSRFEQFQPAYFFYDMELCLKSPMRHRDKTHGPLSSEHPSS